MRTSVENCPDKETHAEVAKEEGFGKLTSSGRKMLPDRTIVIEEKVEHCVPCILEEVEAKGVPK